MDRRVQIPMVKQLLDRLDVVAVLDQRGDELPPF